jgi:hypothetical protein
MIVAALIELYREQESPAAGGYMDVAARNNISPCRSVDDYNPYQYQQWYNGQDVDKPAYCSQTCDDMDGIYLSLNCINCSDVPQMSRVSIFWQIPQFVLIGISEIFALITSLEFFYSQAPSRMRSVSQASNLFTNALGSWLTIPLTLLVNINPNKPWIASNVDEDNLQAYFYLLAGLMDLAMILFSYLSNGYVYADPDVLTALDAPPSTDAREFVVQ